jgi:hypothetical protein
MGDLVPESRQGRIELLVEFFLPTVEVRRKTFLSALSVLICGQRRGEVLFTKILALNQL